MTAEKNKVIVGRFVDEVFNRRNLSALEEIAAPGAADRLKASLAPYQPLFASFPDAQLTVKDMIAEDDLVICQGVWQGTHVGEFMNVPPTGKRVSSRGTSSFHLVGEKVVGVEHRWDDLEVLRQIRSYRAAGVHPSAHQEPVLAIEEIQGNTLIGFDKDYQTLLFLRIVDARLSAAWLRRIAPRVTTLRGVLAARGRLRAEGDVAGEGPPWLNLGFTFAGLKKLGVEAEQFIDLPFKEGMHKRSKLLGDPIEESAEGSCRNWLVGGPHNVPDICLLLASDKKDVLADDVAAIEASLGDALTVILRQDGAVLPAPLKGHEHFGFLDNISQPGVRGRLSNAPDDFLTLRQNPADPHQGKPGQHLIWPGEFVFGYPGQDATDKYRPGVTAKGGPAWAANGSLLVFRRLRQDVEAFHGFLESAAAELARSVPALRGLTPQRLAAKLMGRWASGAPIMRAPAADIPEMGPDACANNNFQFVGDTHHPTSNGDAGKCADRGFPPSAGDLLGLVCPHAAHIRKVYPRDHATSEITRDNIETHRLLRRGVPYGAPYPAPGERGLLFLAYQSSIERQFEFIVRAWLNNPHLRDGDDGYDPIVGQNEGRDGSRARTTAIPVQNPDGSVTKVVVNLPADWVVPTGGGYFFIPSVSALKQIAGG